MADASRRINIGATLQAIQAVATIGAILAGGYWTYMLFFEQRQLFAHLKTEHHLTHVSLPGNRILLMVDVIHSNVGSVKVKLTSGDVKIYTLDPPDPKDADASDAWNLQAETTELPGPARDLLIEPGESDQIHYEFILSDDAPLRIYTYYENPTTMNHTGWVTWSLYDPRKPAASITKP
jgi:hypothetical protein